MSYEMSNMPSADDQNAITNEVSEIKFFLHVFKEMKEELLICLRNVTVTVHYMCLMNIQPIFMYQHKRVVV